MGRRLCRRPAGPPCLADPDDDEGPGSRRRSQGDHRPQHAVDLAWHQPPVGGSGPDDAGHGDRLRPRRRSRRWGRRPHRAQRRRVPEHVFDRRVPQDNPGDRGAAAGCAALRDHAAHEGGARHLRGLLPDGDPDELRGALRRPRRGRHGAGIRTGSDPPVLLGDAAECRPVHRDRHAALRGGGAAARRPGRNRRRRQWPGPADPPGSSRR